MFENIKVLRGFAILRDPLRIFDTFNKLIRKEPEKNNWFAPLIQI